MAEINPGVRPVCLPLSPAGTQFETPGNVGTVVGWGFTSAVVSTDSVTGVIRFSRVASVIRFIGVMSVVSYMSVVSAVLRVSLLSVPSVLSVSSMQCLYIDGREGSMPAYPE